MATTLVYSIHFENDRIELIKMNSIKMNKIKIIFFSHSLKDYVVGFILEVSGLEQCYQ